VGDRTLPKDTRIQYKNSLRNVLQELSIRQTRYKLLVERVQRKTGALSIQEKLLHAVEGVESHLRSLVDILRVTVRIPFAPPSGLTPNANLVV
jgi:hypothetical protein